MMLTSEEIREGCKYLHIYNMVGTYPPESQNFFSILGIKYYSVYDNFITRRRAVLNQIKAEAVSLVARSEGIFLKPKIIEIPRSHINDFKRHVGWYAFLDDPQVKIGQIVIFNLSDIETVETMVTWSGQGNDNYPKDFVNWTIVAYEVLNEAPKTA